MMQTSEMYRAWLRAQAMARWDAEEAAAPVSYETEVSTPWAERHIEVLGTIAGCEDCHTPSIDLLEGRCSECWWDWLMEEVR
jgi:hypothetical protein